MNRRSFFRLAVGGAIAAPAALVGEAVSGARLVPKNETREWGKMADEPVVTINISGVTSQDEASRSAGYVMAHEIGFNNSRVRRG
ncbi:hypothetical protein [Rhizobium phaseoli]|uniref:hypothetical protein n=1 Tax=Rhizobium phaseoli TaxID=396 RepID=UPI00037CDF1A|nr:hypothetical protein [Rhizobium phaseoli]KKZ89064.1 hypothetical protein RPHASCH2410_CH00275 [Rhizobium phaseoli Ch24-10]